MKRQTFASRFADLEIAENFLHGFAADPLLHIWQRMRSLIVKTHISLLLLSIFLTAVPSLGQPATPCELLLRRGPRTTRPDVLAETRMLDADKREKILNEMNAPTASERDEIFSQATPVTKGPPATALARAALAYIVGRADWTPFQKAVFWEAMAVDISGMPGILFRSDFHRGTDGSYLFGGAAGEVVVFRLDGKVLRNSMIFLKPGTEWKADYEDFKVL